MQQGIDNMDVIKRITELTSERGWSTYRLAQKSGFLHPPSPISTAGTRFHHFQPWKPSVTPFGITLSQFFSKDTDACTLNAGTKRNV